MQSAPELPVEVLQLIINNLPSVAALKNVRLVNKLCAALAVKALFSRDSWTLLPYTKDLESFASVMQHNQAIASLVKEIRYDHKLRYSEDLRPLDTDIDANEYAALINELSQYALRHRVDAPLEVSLLAKCLQHLPCLESIETLDVVAERTSFGEPLYRMKQYGRCISLPNYVRSVSASGEAVRLIRAGLFNAGRHVEVSWTCSELVLMAYALAGGRSLRRATLEGVDVGDLVSAPEQGVPTKGLSTYQQIFGQLEELTMHLKHAECPPQSGIRQSLGLLLASAANVKYLDLRFPDHTFPAIHSAPEHSWLSSLVRDSAGRLKDGPVFPDLKVISLSLLACQEEELEALIGTNHAKLIEVYLDHITLSRNFGTTSPACWVRLLKHVRRPECCVYFTDKLTNLSHQWWDVCESTQEEEDGLYKKVFDWMGGDDIECPIECAAVQIGTDGQEIAPHPRAQDRGDYTWRLRYEAPLEDDSDAEESDLGDSDDEHDDEAAQQAELESEDFSQEDSEADTPPGMRGEQVMSTLAEEEIAAAEAVLRDIPEARAALQHLSSARFYIREVQGMMWPEWQR
ncbi:uncharacterized protein AB675_9216 [Cyphellophora attinorum]|uniref:F-box domain-containing protein n=1 Tax=Cyphellophora attinorum TaxID=1664694 RepID=A0A0N1H628_9EURO|nr:uncharacterized protein AB675_9216 [Phialophora attinorum]KPI41406.1 hypothetical protein AB675_9216 [Phialophora attinorum]